MSGTHNYHPEQASGNNGDLWYMWEDGEQADNGTIQVQKVKAHNERAVLSGEMKVEHYLHNALADAGAD